MGVGHSAGIRRARIVACAVRLQGSARGESKPASCECARNPAVSASLCFTGDLVRLCRRSLMPLLCAYNRSTAVLNDLVLLSDSGLFAIMPGAVPPCSSVTVEVSLASESKPRGYGTIWITDMILFRDPVGSWMKDRDDLRPASNDRTRVLSLIARGLNLSHGYVVVHLNQRGVIKRLLFFPNAAMLVEPAADCGYLTSAKLVRSSAAGVDGINGLVEFAVVTASERLAMLSVQTPTPPSAGTLLSRTRRRATRPARS
jgi:hypothetical protein